MAVSYEPLRGWTLPDPAAQRQAAPVTLPVRFAPLWIAAAIATVLVLVTTLRAGIGGGLLSPAGLPQSRIAAAGPLAHLLGSAGSHAQLLMACHVLALFGCCFALLRIATRLSRTDTGGSIVAALLIGVASLTIGPAFVSGATGMAGAFTGAQGAIALTAWSVALALDGALGIAVALLGVACDLRPEVALWGVFALVGASTALVRDGTSIQRAWLRGGACALVLAVPAVLWWAWWGGAGSGDLLHRPTVLSALLHPGDWPVWSVPLQSWVLGSCAMTLGLAGFSALGPDARAARGAFLGLLVAFLLGCVAPLLGNAGALLGAQPLAADTLLQLFAAAVAAAVVVRDLRGGGGTLRLAFSVAIAIGVVVHPYLLPLAALAMLARAGAANGEALGIERRIREWNRVAQCRVALGVVLLAAAIGGALRIGLLH